MDDPIVQEIHDTRRQIMAECHGDLELLIARLKSAESKDQDRLVTLDDIRHRTEVSKGES